MKQIGYKIFGTCYTNQKNTELIPIDVIDTEKVIKLCETIKSDVIIWAILSVDFGEEYLEKMNVLIDDMVEYIDVI